MSDEFRKLVTSLWSKLKLGQPAFRPVPEVILAVDGCNITLAESADGRHLVVSGHVGRLSADPRRRADQVRRLLKANLGLLQGNVAGLALASSDAAALVRAEAVHPYGASDVDRLVAVIEDVLARVEMHAPELAPDERGAATRPENLTAPSHEDFIFRP